MTVTSVEDYPPHVLREYSLLADGYRGALCDPRGTIAWLCAPRWHDDAICSTLIGGLGAYAVTPADRHVWGGYYEPGTLIWRNRWVTTDTTIECRDALAHPGHPDHLVLLRRVHAIERDAHVDVGLNLRGGFGRLSMRQPHRSESGVWTARTGNLRIRWTGASDAHQRADGSLAIRLVVPAGTHHDLLLEVTGQRLPTQPPDVDQLWAATEDSWSSAVPGFTDSVAPRDARHAYAVMRGLTAPGGGMVAAATLGLPERADAGRNYDYRYVWLRDQAYAGLAVAVNDPHPLLDDAVAFATQRLLEHQDQIAPAYRIDGDELPSQSTLSLPGYPGGSDVIGNWVNGQFQLDTMGELLCLFATAARHDHLDQQGYQALLTAIDVIEKRWNEPDAGIWELTNAWWTQSRLACVAGLRTAAAVLPRGDVARLTSLADTIMAETSKNCLSVDGHWRRSPNQTTTDASLLLPPVRGALPAVDPRTVATLRKVTEDLTDDGYAYRFRSDDRPLGDAEGAFLLCGFSMALASWHQGDSLGAFRWFERNRAACGTPGLFAEEYDIRQRQFRGNLPQGFVHAALLEASLRLALSPPNRGERP